MTCQCASEARTMACVYSVELYTTFLSCSFPASSDSSVTRSSISSGLQARCASKHIASVRSITAGACRRSLRDADGSFVWSLPAAYTASSIRRSERRWLAMRPSRQSRGCIRRHTRPGYVCVYVYLCKYGASCFFGSARRSPLCDDSGHEPRADPSAVTQAHTNTICAGEMPRTMHFTMPTAD
jgi:hypothetical protein